VVKVGHRLERSLPWRTREKTRHLLAVTLDDDFFALYGQTVKHPSQIASQFRCCDSLHKTTSLRKLWLRIPEPFAGLRLLEDHGGKSRKLRVRSIASMTQ
jgi:hypothetical protein